MSAERPGGGAVRTLAGSCAVLCSHYCRSLDVFPALPLFRQAVHHPHIPRQGRPAAEKGVRLSSTTTTRAERFTQKYTRLTEGTRK